MNAQKISGILRRPDVEVMLGISTATLYKWMAKGTFPRPIRLGPNSVGWRPADVQRWLDGRPQA